MDGSTVKKPQRERIVCYNTEGVHCRQTLENVNQVLELLEYIDFSEGLSRDGEYGLFLVLETLINAIEDVNLNLTKRE